MLERDMLPEQNRENVKVTLEVRSLEGELWFLRAFPIRRAKEVAGEIMSIKNFWSGKWTLVVRPYNEETDLEDIGNLGFLYGRIELL